MTAATEGRYLTAKEVAAIVGVKLSTVKVWCGSGKLPGTKPGGKAWRIHAADLEQFLAESRPPAKEEQAR